MSIFFFFQAEDGIRDVAVTGVQTCALPISFGGRAVGDDLPKYINSPETPIYSKSNVLYHLDRAKEAIRQQDFAVLVEGYMDTITVARAGLGNVLASCGTSLAEGQVKRSEER